MALADILRRMDSIERRLDEKIEMSMKKVGESFVENAKKSVTQSIYERVTGRTPNRRPGELTKNLLNSIKANRVSDSSLKKLELSAGMEYAAAVEAKGYDVISGSIPQARKDFDIYVKRAMKAAIKDISKT